MKSSLALFLFITLSQCFFVSSMLAISPGSLLLAFLMLIIYTGFGMFMCINDMMSLLLFMVYIGGLLVLIIYLVALSSNLPLKGSHMNMWGWFSLICLTTYMWLSWFQKFHLTNFKTLSSLMTMEFNCLVLLGLFLLLIFVNICNILSIGGRTFNVGVKP